MFARWTMDLADYLADKADQTSFRDVADKVGLGKTTIENIAKRKNANLPELETLIKISRAYGIELYRVIEMLGVDLQLPRDPKSQSLRLAVTLEHMPMLRSIVEKIVTLSETGIRPIIDMLRSYLNVPDESGLTPKGQAELADLLATEEGRKKIAQYLMSRDQGVIDDESR